MVTSCCAFGCTERRKKSSSVSFHRFPTDPAMKNKWILATRRKNFTPSNFTVLCSKHFLESDFLISVGKRRLHEYAVPSVFDFSRFLIKKEVPRRSKRRTIELSVSSDENSDQEEMDTSSENQQNTSASHDLQATRSRTRKRQLEAEKVTEEDPRIAEAYDIIQNCARRDASDVYGEYVASKLRSYSKRTEAVVQHLINNILYNADRGIYDKDANVDDSSVGNQNVCLKSRRSTPSPQSVYFNENQNCSVFPEDLLARHSTSLDDPLNP